MKNLNCIIISFFILISSFVSSNLQSNINNSIAVKVGASLITTIDIQNEIITNLIIRKEEINQENINKNKNYAVKNLINKAIKKNEINKYKVTNFSEKDLQNYITNITKKFNTDKNGLREIFTKYGVSFEEFEKNYEIELLWNTLIYQLYKNQTNVNILEIDIEVKKIKENYNEEELTKIRKDILNKKKIDKLNLFSRSHFSNLENNVVIKFL
jgi:hypothetical protein|tara:strand:+ start:87 stop:725 length:639 start_codon:yes stop_codon:yes gene_type:complete